VYDVDRIVECLRGAGLSGVCPNSPDLTAEATEDAEC